MLKTFSLINQKLHLNNHLKDSTLILLSRPTKDELTDLCQTMDIDPLIFDYFNSPAEVSRLRKITSSYLQQAKLLVVYDLLTTHSKIEDQLSPVILIYDERHLIVCTDNISACFTTLKEGYRQQFSTTSLVFYLVSHLQDHLMNELLTYKQEINRLDIASHKAIQNNELRALTNLTHKLVYFEHTMNDQTSTLKELRLSLKDSQTREQTIVDTQTKQQRLTKGIHIYRDLLTSISGLFTAIMDNRLNHLMKYLDSAGLVIAVAALVSGFMGMNVGGLPGKDNQFGFWLILLFTGILVLAVTILLKRKTYTD